MDFDELKTYINKKYFSVIFWGASALNQTP